MIYILLIILHVIACLVLISVILLQAGRGGGFGAVFGTETAQSLLGTQAPALLKKATTISAIAFLMTSLLLGMITARQGKSLFQRMKMPAMPAAVPQAGEAAPQVPADAPSGEAETKAPEAE